MRSTQGSLSETVAGGARRDVRGRDSVEVHGGRQSTIEGDDIRRVAGSAVSVVGSASAPGSMSTHVEGELRSYATKTMDLTADEELVVRCGESSLRIGPDHVEIISPKMMLAAKDAQLVLADGEIRLSGKNLIQGNAKEILFKSDGAAIGLTSEAAIDGSQVLLNSPAEAQDQVEERTDEPTTIELVDQDGNPIANQRFRIVRGDGSSISGAVDAEGKATVFLDEDAQIEFEGVRDAESE